MARKVGQPINLNARNSAVTVVATSGASSHLAANGVGRGAACSVRPARRPEQSQSNNRFLQHIELLFS